VRREEEREMRDVRGETYLNYVLLLTSTV